MQGEASKSVSYVEWLRQSRGQSTFRSMLEADLKTAIEDANDLGHFYMLMEHMGWEIKHGNRLGFRLRGQERYMIPGRKNPMYTEDGILAAIQGNLDAFEQGKRPAVVYRPSYRLYGELERACDGGQAALRGRAEIALKGKIRTIMIPNKLCRKLLKYAKKQKIASGEVFLTKSGKSISRKQVWAEMKALCRKAGVDAEKVFPHNLRHLFARCFYRVCRDIARLADVLGHSSIETTRIYLISSGKEHERTLERLQLIS